MDKSIIKFSFVGVKLTQKSLFLAKAIKEGLMGQDSFRYYDQKWGLWYLIRWDDVLKCHVCQLISGQTPIVAQSK
ncbi:hypothetical protein C4572_02485 [Candidatus Parcubacteria bacterium]|nr:MAG: hypothetical protein C4572_02485 [Candidatus Parcubacteria bacterium]